MGIERWNGHKNLLILLQHISLNQYILLEWYCGSGICVSCCIPSQLVASSSGTPGCSCQNWRGSLPRCTVLLAVSKFRFHVPGPVPLKVCAVRTLTVAGLCTANLGTLCAFWPNLHQLLFLFLKTNFSNHAPFDNLTPFPWLPNKIQEAATPPQPIWVQQLRCQRRRSRLPQQE